MAGLIIDGREMVNLESLGSNPAFYDWHPKTLIETGSGCLVVFAQADSRCGMRRRTVRSRLTSVSDVVQAKSSLTKNNAYALVAESGSPGTEIATLIETGCVNEISIRRGNVLACVPDCFLFQFG
jgi:hypothetical protein